jgi:hypothetical protein
MLGFYAYFKAARLPNWNLKLNFKFFWLFEAYFFRHTIVGSCNLTMGMASVVQM